jgi:hypothetical protein
MDGRGSKENTLALTSDLAIKSKESAHTMALSGAGGVAFAGVETSRIGESAKQEKKQLPPFPLSRPALMCIFRLR